MFLSTINGLSRPRAATQLRTANDLINRIFSGFEALPVFSDDSDGNFVPKIDVKENEKAIEVKVDLPGMNRDQIEIELTGDTLTIRGEKKEERQEKDEKGTRYYSERRYGMFQRVVNLGCEVDREKADVIYKDGVLTVTLPKNVECCSGKKLKIRSE